MLNVAFYLRLTTNARALCTRNLLSAILSCMKRIFDAIEKKVWIIVHLSSEVFCGLWSDIKAGQSLRTFNDIAQAHPHANDTHKSKMFSTLCLSFFRSPFINTLHICLLYRLLVAPARRWFWAFVRRVAWTKERSLCSVRITYIYKVDLCSCSYQCMANGVLSTFIHCSFQYLYVIRDLSLSLYTRLLSKLDIVQRDGCV